MKIDEILEEGEKFITLIDGTRLFQGDECLAGHPLTLHYRKATIVDFIHGSGVRRAIVRDTHGEEWVASRYVLRRWR